MDSQHTPADSLNPETQRDDRLMALLEAALGRPPVDRDHWVQSQCPDDPTLALEVLERASWEEKMGGFLRDPIVPRAPHRDTLFTPGSVLAGRYRIVRELGRGRASAVYEALDTESNLRVALKLRATGLDWHAPSHEGIARILGNIQVETAEGPLHVTVLELLEGPLLADVVRHTVLPPADARQIAHQLCSALLYAAAAGFSPASLSLRGVILTPRGPVLTEDWIRSRGGPQGRESVTRQQVEAADLAAFGSILRRLGIPFDQKATSLRALESSLRPARPGLLRKLFRR